MTVSNTNTNFYSWGNGVYTWDSNSNTDDIIINNITNEKDYDILEKVALNLIKVIFDVDEKAKKVLMELLESAEKPEKQEKWIEPKLFKV